MATNYIYRLMNKGVQVGTFALTEPIQGKSLTVFEIRVFKQPYSKVPKTINIPIGYIVSDDGVTITTERVLDVSKKSQRQIDILKAHNGAY